MSPSERYERKQLGALAVSTVSRQAIAMFWVE